MSNRKAWSLTMVRVVMILIAVFFIAAAIGGRNLAERFTTMSPLRAPVDHFAPSPLRQHAAGEDRNTLGVLFEQANVEQE